MAPPLLLIVDESALVRAHLADLAEATGFRTAMARNGEEALERMERSAPDILVTARHLDGVACHVLIRGLREHPRFAAIPIMVVTADDTREAKIELLRAGADELFTKPIYGKEFQARLGSLALRRDLTLALTSVTAERDDALARLEARNQELESLTLGLVAALEKANILNDDDTGNHIRRVCSYAALLARVHGESPAFIENMGRFAGLHDVGKVGIRDAILKKPGKLTLKEFEEMKRHTIIGADLLRSAGLPDVAWNVARHHHERWDGSGYPDQLSGEGIPLEARIVAVVDVFDALVNKRCYKPAFTLADARAVMAEASGSHLDTRLVDLFWLQIDEVLEIAAAYGDGPVDALQRGSL